jgi:hypothetical protein
VKTTKGIACLLACAAWSAPLLAQGGFSGPGRYEIMNLKSGKALDLDRDQRSLIQLSSRGGQSQAWEITPAGGGSFYIRNAMSGCALDMTRGGNSWPVHCTPFNGDQGQQWRLEPGKDGNALIVARNGRTLDIPDGTDRDGVRVQVYDLNGDSNQRFILRRVGGYRGGDMDRRDRDHDDDRDRRGAGTIVCASNSGDRVFCEADTRYGITMVRQISGSPCRQGETWGWDRRGIWVDRGCRAEFAMSAPREGGYGDRRARTIVCSSDDGRRNYCDVDLRYQHAELVRQISGSPCREGETWGWDRRGVWVDRGCRAEFAITDRR